MKKLGTILQGQRLYAEAKAISDEAIAHLAAALAKTAGEVAKGLIGAAVEVWKVNQAADTARRETLRHRVEAERWRSFGEVPAA